jgi:hypothetical protein
MHEIELPASPFRIRWQETGLLTDKLWLGEQDPKSATHASYTVTFEYRKIAGILPWRIAPTGQYPPIYGIEVLTRPGAGSLLYHTIIANIRGHFKTVFSETVGHGWTEPGLEVVDLNGDGLPELIATQDYRLLRNPRNRNILNSYVYRWSTKLERYTLVRYCAYKDRLKPLPRN